MTPEMFRKLTALGLSQEQMAGVLEIFDGHSRALIEAEENRKASGRERWHRWNDKRKANVSKHEQTLANNSRDRDARVEDNLQTKISTGQEEKKKNTPRDELATVLDAERADAVIEHRQRLRKPLTARAAHLLASKLSSAPDANAAADLMIEKGWQSFELDWIDKPSPRSTAPPSERTVSDVFREISAGKWNPLGQDHEQPDFIETSFTRRN